jgi:tetratricopeptide (TPR) repeat protein
LYINVRHFRDLIRGTHPITHTGNETSNALTGEKLQDMESKRASKKKRRFDPRAMEVMSARVGRLLSGQNFSSLEEANLFLMENAFGSKLNQLDYNPKAPIELAQYIIWDAFGEPSSRKRVSMAYRALEVCPDCADAYVVLAEDRAFNPTEEIEFYRKGVEAGRRALGAQVLNSPDTSFWSELATRPYMRAMSGLAWTLHEQGESAEAIDLWKELLRLDPTDHQGVRWMLAPALVAKNLLNEALDLLNQFDGEGSAYMLYSRALCLFKMNGDSVEATHGLEHAIAANVHVLEYLLGLRKLPEHPENSFSPGSPEEAYAYISVGIQSWIDTDGALDWISHFLRRELQNQQLAQTFPGLTSDAPATNIIDLNSLRRR